METLEELCNAIGELCDPTVALKNHMTVDPDLLRQRGEQLLALSVAIEVSRQKAKRRKRRSAATPIAPTPILWPLLFGCMLVAIAACYAWWPALSYNFSGGFFMDDAMIKKNPNVFEDIDWRRIFRTDYWGLEMFEDGVWTHKSFRPLAVLTFRLNYWLHTFESSGFHITNLGSHALASALLGLFGSWSIGLPADWSCLLTVLFFAHPVHTENVLYIVGRADLLCMTLIFLAALLYAPCVAGRARGIFGAVLLLVASALLVAAGLCKETGFCFFGLLAGWEILRALRMGSARKHQSERYWRLATILLLGSVACYWRCWYTGTAIERMDPQSNSIAVHDSKFVRVLSYALIHGIYGKLLIWPSFLCYDYSLDAIPLVMALDDVRLLLPLAVYLALVLLLLLALGSLSTRALVTSLPTDRDPCEGPIIGVATIVLSFAPMSNILFPVGTMVGERLLYIPSAGLLITLVCLAHLSGPRGGSRALSVLLLVAGLAAAWRCAVRVPEWESADSITAADGIRQLRSSRVQFNFANVHLQAKRYEEALATYQRAIDVDDKASVQDSLPLYHAGQILFFKGQHAEAVRYLERAVTGFYSPLTIKEEEIFHDFALALWFVERCDDSILNFQKSLALNPGFTKSLNNMACALGTGALSGKLHRQFYDHAIQTLDQAVRLEPSNILYWRNAIALMSAGGDFQRANTVLQQLLAMDPMGGHQLDPPRECTWEFYFR